MIADILALIWGVLGIVLFFKIWSMTNDVKTIKDILLKYNTSKQCKPTKEDSPGSISSTRDLENRDTPFAAGDLVVDRNQIQWRVVEFKGNVVVCKNSTKGIAEFGIDELKLFGY